MKNDITEIYIDKFNTYKIGRMIEEICDKYNLHNYFGLISVAVAQACEIAFARIEKNKKITFSYSQCVGGVCFALQSKSQIFKDLNFNSDIDCNSTNQAPETIIKMLTNELYVNEDGRELEMIFYVNGIEPDKLLDRQNKLKTYFNKPLTKTK